MNWRLIDKSKTKQPTKGNYKSWKNIIRKEGYYQCVYCAIKESRFGGLRNFHIEHYRPKSVFKKLTNDIKNLFYACAICNTFKGDDWPAEPNNYFKKSFYPSPAEIDYNNLFYRDNSTFKIIGKNITAKFLIEKLYLNRPQLITERRFSVIRNKIDNLATGLNELLPEIQKQALKKNNQAINVLADIAKANINIVQLQNQLSNTTPYEIEDIKR